VAFLNLLNGYKTYFAAAGMLGLGAYQLATGQFAPGLQTLFSALAAFGIRSAIAGMKS
jgi:hypothetical protein